MYFNIYQLVTIIGLLNVNVHFLIDEIIKIQYNATFPFLKHMKTMIAAARATVDIPHPMYVRVCKASSCMALRGTP